METITGYKFLTDETIKLSEESIKTLLIKLKHVTTEKEVVIGSLLLNLQDLQEEIKGCNLTVQEGNHSRTVNRQSSGVLSPKSKSAPRR